MSSLNFIDLLIKISLIQASVLLFLYFLKNRKASVRYQFLRISLILILVLPLYSVLTSSGDYVLYEHSRSSEEAKTVSSSVTKSVYDSINDGIVIENKSFKLNKPKTNQRLLSSENQNNISKINPIENRLNIKFLYISIIALFIIRFIIGSLKLKKLRSSLYHSLFLSNILDRLKINRQVLLYLSNKSVSPMTWGILKPKIIIPLESENWDKEMMEMTLLHESIHIKRYDYVLNLFSYFLLCLLWFNPISYIFYSRFRVEQETSCDEKVVEHSKSDFDYANHLVFIAKMLVKNKGFLQAGVHMLNKKQLAMRVKEILIKKQNLSASMKLTLLLPFLVLITFTTMSFKSIGLVESSKEPINKIKKDDLSLQENQDTKKADFVPSIIPLERVKIKKTVSFGKTIKAFGKKINHKGLDLACKKGTDVLATADGIISFSGDKGNYGLHIEIQHTAKQSQKAEYKTRYSHLSKLFVKNGQFVKRGDKIGEVGSTGKSTGNHLHYDVKFKGDFVDPENYMPVFVTN